jgi:hypothetical protein
MRVKKSDTSLWIVSSVLVLTLLLNVVIFSIVFLGNCPQEAGVKQQTMSKETTQTCERSATYSFIQKVVEVLKDI